MRKLVMRLLAGKSTSLREYDAGAADVSAQLAAARRDVEEGDVENAEINLAFGAAALSDLRARVDQWAAAKAAAAREAAEREAVGMQVGDLDD